MYLVSWIYLSVDLLQKNGEGKGYEDDSCFKGERLQVCMNESEKCFLWTLHAF